MAHAQLPLMTQPQPQLQQSHDYGQMLVLMWQHLVRLEDSQIRANELNRQCMASQNTKDFFLAQLLQQHQTQQMSSHAVADQVISCIQQSQVCTTSKHQVQLPDLPQGIMPPRVSHQGMVILSQLCNDT